MARLVRCPKCHKLLVEYPNVPVYQCGGCGIVLRAKNHNAAGENAAPGSPQTNHPESQSDHGFSDSGSTSSVRDMTPSPSTMKSEQVEKGGKDSLKPSISSPCSNFEDNNHDKEECSGEHAVEEVGSGDSSRIRFSSGDIDVETENQQVEFDQEDNACELNKQVENTQQLSEPVFLNSTNEVAHSIASQEDMADRAQQGGVNDVLKSPATMSSHAYDGSISSSDDARSVHTPDRHLAKSRRTFKASHSAEGKLKSRSLASDLSNERNGSGMMRSFQSSFDSEEFQPMHNWMALQKDGPSGIAPKGSFKGDMHDKVELLRKIDEVRDQLVKICVAGEQTNIYRSHANLFDHPSQASSYVPVRNASQKYPFPAKHFPEHAYCSCLHCLEEQRLHMMPNLHGHGPYRTNAHDSLSSLSSRSGSVHKHDDHDSEKSHLKDRPKRHCRPISRAAPFVICYKCMKLLQLPADFLISRRKVYKLQCGACSEVLELPFPAKARSLSEAAHAAIEVDDGHVNGRRTGSTSPYNDQHHREGRDVKADAAAAAAARLHRLMGYPSASDLLYQHDSDRGYESTESMTRHSYRPQEQSRASRGRGSSCPYHEHIGNVTNPDSVAIHEAGETSRRPTKPGIPRPEMLK